MRRLAALAVCLAVAFGLFYLQARTPAPLSAAAPAGVFSAGRAMKDIAVMGARPHPVGSPANARVRDYLFARMTALGLSPRLQRAASHGARRFGDDTWVAGATVENLIGILPGRDRSAPAIALMAHYDSVPGSPGAADDITGVASILEMVRALEAGGVPARDVVVVFTDGEEAGLLGARAFFAGDPAARRIGFLFNLESRGGGGRALMFETAPGDGATIDLFRRTARRPSSNALLPFIYSLLPNDTDFSVAKARGLRGLNYAFIGRQFDYHSPSSTVAALDRGSVQHIGEEVLGTARALARSAVLPARSPDVTYGNLFGDWIIAYPAWAGWIVLAVAAGLTIAAWARADRRGRMSGRAVLGGCGTGLLLLGLGAGIFWLARLATGVGSGWMAYRPLLARFPAYEAMLATAGVGAILLAAGLVAGRGRLAANWVGLLITGLAAGVALQIAAPVIGFIVAWPLTASAAVAALTRGGTGRNGVAWTGALVIVILTLAWIGALFHAFLQGLDMAPAAALFVWLAALAIWPLAWPGEMGAFGRFAPALVVLVVASAACLWLRVSDPWSAPHPRAVMPLLVVDGRGASWRATPLTLDPWTRAVLTADGGAIGRRSFPTYSKPLAAAPAPAVAVAAPAVTVTRRADGETIVHAAFAADVLSLDVDARADVPLTDTRLDGQPAAILAPAGSWTHFRWQASPGGLTFSFRPTRPGVLDLRWAYDLAGWPAGTKPLPVPPVRDMAWDTAGSTVVTGERRVALTR